jgi:hypothetical protein
MSPETARYLAEGTKEHYGLSAAQIQYFTVGMTSKDDADQHAAQQLAQLPIDLWASVREETLILSRLLGQLYNSAGDMWSSW